MKANADKCHLIVSTDESFEIQIGESLAKLITNLSLILMLNVFVRREITRLCKSDAIIVSRKKEASHEFFFNAQLNHYPLI